MARLTQVSEKSESSGILPVIFDRKLAKRTLKGREKSKLGVFEAGLAQELRTADTMEQSVEKIVKMALTCEFGAELVTKPGAKRMISTISRGILASSELRRSALIIADRFACLPVGTAGSGSKKQVMLRSRSKRKAVLNG